MMTSRMSVHEESWLLLPWLANGRLPAHEREPLEAHVRECAACAQELGAQRRVCEALAEPDRVTYAPGPSFRKLMERIDGPSAAPARPERPAPRTRAAGAALSAAWRPPGLAWAATFLFTVGLGLLVSTTYRWSQPSYATYTSGTHASPDVLHIAFERSLPVGEVELLLRVAGARVVEGPGTSGVFGVTPVALAAGAQPGEVSSQVRALAARLRADARVRWIEPLPAQPGPPNAPGARNPDP